jgi:hypothetical protein
MQLPSGEYAHDSTLEEWPIRVSILSPVSPCQIFSVLSSEAETIRLPSGEYAHPNTQPL